MGARVAGICYIKVDGKQLSIKGDIEVPLTETKKETVMGLSGPAGYKEEPVMPYVKMTAIFTADFPLAEVRAASEATVTAELANGKVYTLSKAYLVGEPAVKVSEGEVELEFNGDKGMFQ